MTEAFAPERILYGKELDKWLGSFPGMDKDQCLEKIDAIWAEQGFLSPADLSTELLASQLVPDASNVNYELLIYNLMESAHPRDQLTGFADKPESPLLTGLCHLYAQRTGVPVTLVDGDYGNMGGTNGYYRDLMKQAGLGGNRFDDGFDETDRVARVTARITEKSLEKLVSQHEGAKLMRVRSGGDEIRLIVIGIDSKTVDNWLFNETHPEIERFTAEANIHDHAHGKEPENENKRGFGLALAAESLNRRDIEPNQIVENLDSKIKVEKYNLGAERRGAVFGAEQYDDASLLQAQTSARRKKREFDSLKAKTPDPLQFNRRLTQHPQYGAMALAQAIDPSLPIQLDLTNSDEMPYTGLFKRMHNQLDKNLAATASDIDPYNQNILHSALDRAMPIDHSAGVFGTRYLEATTAMYMHDAAEQQGGRAHLGHFEFSHLAAFNNFSHNHGDAVLGHIGTIIKEEMMNAGMVMDEVSALEREEYNVFHRGGARFNMCMPDTVRQKDAAGNDVVYRVNDEIITELGSGLIH